MARPTDDKKESKVILRINDETRKSIEKASRTAGLSMSEYIRDILTSKHDIELSKYGITPSIIADFEVILNIYDTNFEDFFKKLYEKVRDGEIDVDEILK